VALGRAVGGGFDLGNQGSAFASVAERSPDRSPILLASVPICFYPI